MFVVESMSGARMYAPWLRFHLYPYVEPGYLHHPYPYAGDAFVIGSATSIRAANGFGPSGAPKLFASNTKEAIGQ